jgi:hypothetical protein
MIGLISELGYNRDTGATYQVDTAERTLPKLVSRNYSKVLGCFRRTALD